MIKIDNTHNIEGPYIRKKVIEESKWGRWEVIVSEY